MTSDCPECYDWVQRQVRVVRQQLLTLNEIITYVKTRPPQQINDTEYIDQLMAVNDTVQQLWQDASVHGTIGNILPVFYTSQNTVLCQVNKRLGSVQVFISFVIVCKTFGKFLIFTLNQNH